MGRNAKKKGLIGALIEWIINGALEEGGMCLDSQDIDRLTRGPVIR